MKNCIRNHYFLAFFVSLVISIGLLITSFFLPPQGEIHPSVLQGTAILFCYPALAFGAKALDDNKQVKIHTKVGSITVGKDGPGHRDMMQMEDYDGPEMMEGEEDA